MKNILILNGLFFPSPSSNGICAYKLAQELRNRGCNVTFVADQLSESIKWIYDDFEVYGVRPSGYLNLQKEIEESNGLKKKFLEIKYKYWVKLDLGFNIFKFRFPKKRVNDFFIVSKQIIEAKKIDTIIAISRPHETLKTALKLKEIYSNMKLIAYFCDVLNDNSFSSKIRQKIYKYGEGILYNQLFDNFYSVLLPQNYKIIFALEYPFLANRAKYFLFPLYDSDISLKFKNITNKKEILVQSKINIAFAGGLPKDIRPPDVLNILCKIVDMNSNIIIHFYSKGYEDELQKYKLTLNDNLILHGIVAKKELEEILFNSSILLNISNKISSHVPSKIFEYFAYAKPIINYQFIPNDPATEFLNKYPLFYNIKSYESVNIEELLNFIENSPLEKIDKSLLDKTFYMSTPKANLDLFWDKEKITKDISNQRSSK